MAAPGGPLTLRSLVRPSSRGLACP